MIPFASLIEPGTLVCFTGRMRSGKTANMTRCLFKAKNKGYAVYANYSTLFAQRLQTTAEVFGKDEGVKGPGIIALDELQVILDSRSFSANSELTERLMFVGKRKLALWYTAQNIGMVDLRVRQQTRYVFFHERYRGGSLFQVAAFDGIATAKVIAKEYLRFTPQLYNLYDTYDMNVALIPEPKVKSKPTTERKLADVFRSS